MNAPVLEIENLTVEFPTKRGVVRAVNHVSLTLHKGEKLGLVGESGSGKSMTLLTLLRLTPHPGRVTSGALRYEPAIFSDFSPTKCVRSGART